MRVLQGANASECDPGPAVRFEERSSFGIVGSCASPGVAPKIVPTNSRTSAGTERGPVRSAVTWFLCRRSTLDISRRLARPLSAPTDAAVPLSLFVFPSHRTESSRSVMHRLEAEGKQGHAAVGVRIGKESATPFGRAADGLMEMRGCRLLAGGARINRQNPQGHSISRRGGRGPQAGGCAQDDGRYHWICLGSGRIAGCVRCLRQWWPMGFFPTDPVPVV